MANNNLEFIKYMIDNWKSVKGFSKDIWEKIAHSFEKGNKVLGFIKNKDRFNHYIELSKSAFTSKYSKYIIPSEYRGFILNAIDISEEYKKSKSLGDKLRASFKTEPKILRIYNLYNSGVLGFVFTEIDKMIEEKKNNEEIIGKISKELDDKINDKSIIYVSQDNTKEDIYSDVVYQLSIKKYCIIYGANKNNVDKVKYVENKVLENDKDEKYYIKSEQQIMNGISHIKLLICEKSITINIT